ncbi:MAG TPA: hypothetical protein PKC68_04740 [Alphaproteobacteria bacterium]|jgi:hypothetical protein|nr:hypothetical protein [Alphaproteobacteria bacterium]
MDKTKVIQALNILAQERHLKIFRLLLGKCPMGIIMGAIGDALQLSHAALSLHWVNILKIEDLMIKI